MYERLKLRLHFQHVRIGAIEGYGLMDRRTSSGGEYSQRRGLTGRQRPDSAQILPLDKDKDKNMDIKRNEEEKPGDHTLCFKRGAVPAASVPKLILTLRFTIT